MSVFFLCVSRCSSLSFNFKCKQVIFKRERAAKSDNIRYFFSSLAPNRFFHSVFNRFKRAIKPHNFNLKLESVFIHHHFNSRWATRRLKLNCMHRIPGFSLIFKTILSFFYSRSLCFVIHFLMISNSNSLYSISFARWNRFFSRSEFNEAHRSNETEEKKTENCNDFTIFIALVFLSHFIRFRLTKNALKSFKWKQNRFANFIVFLERTHRVARISLVFFYSTSFGRSEMTFFSNALNDHDSINVQSFLRTVQREKCLRQKKNN